MKYAELVGVYERLEGTAKRLEKTAILSEFLKNVSDEKVLLLVQGRVFPNWDPRELGVAAKLLVKAVQVATGASLEKIEGVWMEKGDLGLAADELVGKKTQATLFREQLSCAKVFDNLRKVAELEGEGVVDRKVQLIAELLSSAGEGEAKYIVRTVLQELRIGLGEGTIRDSIVWAFFGEKYGAGYDAEKNSFTVREQDKYGAAAALVQDALDRLNDVVEVVQRARQGEDALRGVELVPLRPVKVMLYQKALNVANALEIVGVPAAAEFKYDGFRLQIHRDGDKIVLFTRRLEDVTAQFPDVVSVVRKNIKSARVIIDAEVVGVDPVSGKYLPFQNISQRIKRKYDIGELAAKFPVEVNVFDILFMEKSLIDVPFEKRRMYLKEITEELPGALKLAEQTMVNTVEEGEKVYARALEEGNEGLMMKNVQAMYKPGSRVGFGVKVKPTMDTLEVAVVGAEWGEGKRGAWLASFIVAVRDPESGKFLEIGRVGTGIKEKSEEGTSFEQLTALLLPLKTEESGREIRVIPKVVMEVDYEEIQASKAYSSGFALRFPRMVRLREDRAAGEVSTIDDVRRLAGAQRGRDQ
ncbi:ATP-dependent DNA ligase [Candidatus Woesearchaeota archaeon]|nr:MAG: ATP-dependent DNA ligase [Candidatus Woesearchaeota archaeon]